MQLLLGSLVGTNNSCELFGNNNTIKEARIGQGNLREGCKYRGSELTAVMRFRQTDIITGVEDDQRIAIIFTLATRNEIIEIPTVSCFRWFAFSFDNDSLSLVRS